jgi:putative hydroxymethylpyrimidine transport system permease protein
MMAVVRPVVTFGGLLLLWQTVIWTTGVERFILPSPGAVLTALLRDHAMLGYHALITISEILLGLLAGTVCGVLTAATLSYFRRAQRWLMPVLLVVQAMPVFALAPILVLWLGFGLGSKIAMATLIIYFPVTAAFLDGLRRTETGWLDLARTMNGGRLNTLLRLRVPAALPALASGLRVATAVAPIGAVVAEWVGASAGLGFLMLHANARLQIDVMFAALFILALFSVGLYFTVDRLLRRAMPWQADSLPSDDRED